MAERDFSAAHPVPAVPTFLPGTAIEILRPLGLTARPRHALFDFDGTLSLIREGWVEVMVPLLLEKLLPWARPDEDAASLEALVREFVMRLTGKQTIYQMMRLAEEIEARGGRAADPRDYKAEYHERLMSRIAGRRDDLAAGRARPEDFLVPGSLDILAGLAEEGVAIYVASGTDEAYVLEEARLLGIDAFAPGRIYGAQADHRAFSKEMVIRRILEEHRVDGQTLLGFGDGYVEIADTKAVGGTAVAVASDEAARSGKADEWKRERLIGAGADLVVPDYQEARALLGHLFPAARTGGGR